MAPHRQVGHDGSVRCDVILFLICIERYDKGGVIVAVVGHHCVLVDAAGADGEVAHIVGVYLACRLEPDVHFFVLARREGWHCCCNGVGRVSAAVTGVELMVLDQRVAPKA